MDIYLCLMHKVSTSNSVFTHKNYASTFSIFLEIVNICSYEVLQRIVAIRYTYEVLQLDGGMNILI